MADKNRIREEFNEFLDSASDETIKDFMQFMKERRRKKEEEKNNFNNRLN